MAVTGWIWAVAAAPLALGGLALHPVDHPVDDHVAFELGEHAEHLYQHPPGRGGGVERLGRRPEHHPGLVQLIQDVHQPPQGAGEPVDPVDQQHVEPPGPGSGEGFL